MSIAILPGIGDADDWDGIREADQTRWFPPPGKMNVPKGYPNEWVEVPVYTHLPTSGNNGHEPNSRNHINILSADVVVALPGGPGTGSELQLAALYGKPKMAFLGCKGPDGPKGIVVGIDKVPGGVDVATDLATVQRFVLSAVIGCGKKSMPVGPSGALPLPFLAMATAVLVAGVAGFFIGKSA